MSIVQRLGSYRWFARLARAVVPIDRFVARATKGRIVALGLAPSFIITTTGRRSGLPRTQPLTYAPDGGGGFAVIGSNWGQTSHPAWSANLLANPHAVVRLKGRTIPVEAVLTSGEERERLWGLLLRTWPAYRVYQERAHRELRIFKLTPRAQTAPAQDGGTAPAQDA